MTQEANEKRKRDNMGSLITKHLFIYKLGIKVERI